MPHRLPQASPLVEWSYRLGLAFQTMLGLTQLSAGLLLWFAPGDSVHRFVAWLAANKLALDQDDALLHRAMDWAVNMTHAEQNFYAIYLLGHGALNIVVAMALLFRVRGSYVISLSVLAGFVIYQTQELLRTHDLVLVLLTAIDCAVIWLILLERKQTRARESARQKHPVVD